MLYLWARYYHPKLGAFTSVDPVLGVGGRYGIERLRMCILLRYRTIPIVGRPLALARMRT
ncbi:MAG: hypothetical protein IAE83_09865, partial [Anaerolinea sp.]|nr:hypothetical protein [Anaerolinea sp.]